MALLERIVSSPSNVFVADSRSSAVQSAITGMGTRTVIIPRTVIWPTLERFVNDNGAFPIFNPSAQDPDFVWSSITQSAQTLGFAVSSTTYTFSQSTSLDINVTAFADNAMQMQIDLVNASTGAIISTPPLGTLLNDGNMNAAAGVLIEKRFFPYNWQNVRFYSISTGIIAAGQYKIILSFTAVNYDQFPDLENPAAIAFATDIHELSPFSVPCGMPSCRWTEDPNNPVYNPPPPNKAFYQTVRYRADGFAPFGTFAFYKMWYDFDSNGGIAYASSPDGINFTFQANTTGLAATARHSRVLFDSAGFGIGAPYRIWYWATLSPFFDPDPAMPTALQMIRTASSLDGTTWFNDMPIMQNPLSPLLIPRSSPNPPYNIGSYGPADILYFPENPPVLDLANPFNNRYVMYHNITDGGSEQIALAVSIDGITWSKVGPLAVLTFGGPGTWDAKYATEHAVVLRLAPNNFMMWYSGGREVSHEGIGCASSTDGINWTKFPGNPIFSIFDGVLWRTVRTYTPWVLFDPLRFSGHGDTVCFKFWMSGGSSDSDLNIGYATNLLS